MREDCQQIINTTRAWVEKVVVGLNLCPFAKKELVKNRVRFVASQATSEASLLNELTCELALLNTDESVETTLLIHPHVLQVFKQYNYFLNQVDALLHTMSLEGIYQVASFHPDYQFAGTGVDDVENYTNRSPYPMLHLLREESLSRAIDHYPDVNLIPERNIQCMNTLGSGKLQTLLAGLTDAGSMDKEIDPRVS